MLSEYDAIGALGVVGPAKFTNQKSFQSIAVIRIILREYNQINCDLQGSSHGELSVI